MIAIGGSHGYLICLPRFRYLLLVSSRKENLRSFWAGPRAGRGLMARSRYSNSSLMPNSNPVIQFCVMSIWLWDNAMVSDLPLINLSIERNIKPFRLWNLMKLVISTTWFTLEEPLRITQLGQMRKTSHFKALFRCLLPSIRDLSTRWSFHSTIQSFKNLSGLVSASVVVKASIRMVCHLLIPTPYSRRDLLWQKIAFLIHKKLPLLA